MKTLVSMIYCYQSYIGFYGNIGIYDTLLSRYIGIYSKLVPLVFMIHCFASVIHRNLWYPWYLWYGTLVSMIHWYLRYTGMYDNTCIYNTLLSKIHRNLWKHWYL